MCRNMVAISRKHGRKLVLCGAARIIMCWTWYISNNVSIHSIDYITSVLYSSELIRMIVHLKRWMRTLTQCARRVGSEMRRNWVKRGSKLAKCGCPNGGRYSKDRDSAGKWRFPKGLRGKYIHASVATLPRLYARRKENAPVGVAESVEID